MLLTITLQDKTFKVEAERSTNKLTMKQLDASVKQFKKLLRKSNALQKDR